MKFCKRFQNPHSLPSLSSALKFIPFEGKVITVLFVLTEHHDMKAYWGSGCTAPRIL
jgi:hypothetical protein